MVPLLDVHARTDVKTGADLGRTTTRRLAPYCRTCAPAPFAKAGR